MVRRGLLLSAVLAALFLLPGTARGDDCPFADAGAGQATAQQLDLATVCLLDRQRADHGLAPLAPNLALDVTATKYSHYMVAKQHFDHVDLAGRTVVDRVKADDPSLLDNLSVLGENLAWGSYDLATPRSIVAGWMNSPGHRANILYPGYKMIGIGVTGGAPRAGESSALTYTTVFGDPMPPSPHRRHRQWHKVR